jgi:signal transduction histidine kinase
MDLVLNKEKTIERQILSIIIVLTLVLNLLAMPVMWGFGITVFLLRSVAGFLFALAALFALLIGNIRWASTIFSLSMLYVAMVTVLLADLLVIQNNPLIPIGTAVFISGAYHSKRRITMGIALTGLMPLAFFAWKVFDQGLYPDRSSPFTVVYATLLSYIFMVFPAYLMTVSNHRRIVLSEENEASTRRLLADEKLQGSELLLPAISHEIAGSLGNASMLSGLALELLDSGEDQLPPRLPEVIEQLNTSIKNTVAVIERYRNLMIHRADTADRMNLNELINLAMMSIIFPGSEPDLHLDGDDHLSIDHGEEMLKIIRELALNSSNYAQSESSHGEVHIRISWKMRWANDLIDDGLIDANRVKSSILDRNSQFYSFLYLEFQDNGPGFSPDASRYLQRPILKSYQGKSKASLGLYLTRLRMERSYDGHILIDTQGQSGAKLIMLIPSQHVFLEDHAGL